jgi:hypothetical protein
MMCPTPKDSQGEFLVQDLSNMTSFGSRVAVGGIKMKASNRVLIRWHPLGADTQGEPGCRQNLTVQT